MNTPRRRRATSKGAIRVSVDDHGGYGRLSMATSRDDSHQLNHSVPLRLQTAAAICPLLCRYYFFPSFIDATQNTSTTTHEAMLRLWGARIWTDGDLKK